MVVQANLSHTVLTLSTDIVAIEDELEFVLGQGLQKGILPNPPIYLTKDILYVS